MCAPIDPPAWPRLANDWINVFLHSGGDQLAAMDALEGNQLELLWKGCQCMGASLLFCLGCITVGLFTYCNKQSTLKAY